MPDVNELAKEKNFLKTEEKVLSQNMHHENLFSDDPFIEKADVET